MFIVFLFFLISNLRATSSSFVDMREFSVEENKGNLTFSLTGQFNTNGGYNDLCLISEIPYFTALKTYIDLRSDINSNSIPPSDLSGSLVYRKIYDACSYDLNHDGRNELIFLSSVLVTDLLIPNEQRFIIRTVDSDWFFSRTFLAKDKLSVVDIDSDTYLDLIASELTDDNHLKIIILNNQDNSDSFLIDDNIIFPYLTHTLSFENPVMDWGFSSLHSSGMSLFVLLGQQLQIFSNHESTESNEYILSQSVSLPENSQSGYQFHPFRKYPSFNGQRFDIAITTAPSSSTGNVQLYFCNFENSPLFVPILNEQLSGSLEQFYVPEMFDKKIAAYYRNDHSEGGILAFFDCVYDETNNRIVLNNEYIYHCNSKPLQVSYQTSQYPNPTYSQPVSSKTNPPYWIVLFDSKMVYLAYDN